MCLCAFWTCRHQTSDYACHCNSAWVVWPGLQGYLVQLLHSSCLFLIAFLASLVRLTVGWTFCRDNRAPAGGRGVVFVGGPGGGPNSAAYARPQYGARRNGGPAGSGTIQAQIQENIARHAERAPEGPPQVTPPAPAACMPQLLLPASLAVSARHNQSRLHRKKLDKITE